MGSIASNFHLKNDRSKNSLIYQRCGFINSDCCRVSSYMWTNLIGVMKSWVFSIYHLLPIDSYSKNMKPTESNMAAMQIRKLSAILPYAPQPAFFFGARKHICCLYWESLMRVKCPKRAYGPCCKFICFKMMLMNLKTFIIPCWLAAPAVDDQVQKWKP